MIGIVFAWVLGIGVLLLAVLATTPGGSNGVTLASTLFGSIFSLTSGQALLAAVVALVVVAALGAMTRPLLLTTVDGELAIVGNAASARGGKLRTAETEDVGVRGERAKLAREGAGVEIA